MTVTATNKTADKNDVNATSYVTASVSFLANRLYLLSFASHGPAGSAHRITASGTITTAQVATVEFNTIAAPNKRISVFRCMPTGDEATTITFDATSTTMQHGFWSIEEFDGVVMTGVAGADAIVQALTDRSDSASSLTVTLSPFEGTNVNVAYGWFGRAENQNMTEGGLFTPLSEITGTETPTTSTLAEWAPNDNTIDCSFATAGPCAGIGIEVRGIAGGDSFPTRRTMVA